MIIKRTKLHQDNTFWCNFCLVLRFFSACQIKDLFIHSAYASFITAAINSFGLCRVHHPPKPSLWLTLSFRLSNQRFVHSFRLRFIHNGGIVRFRLKMPRRYRLGIFLTAPHTAHAFFPPVKSVKIELMRQSHTASYFY